MTRSEQQATVRYAEVVYQATRGRSSAPTNIAAMRTRHDRIKVEFLRPPTRAFQAGVAKRVGFAAGYFALPKPVLKWADKALTVMW